MQEEVSYLEYNSERSHLIIPEYGRHVHQMIDQAVALKDKDERNKMAKAKNARQTIILESTADTGYRYTTKKNKREHPARVEYKKYDPVVRKHVIFKETK